LRLGLRFELGLIVALGTFVGVAGCNTQSLVPDAGGTRGGPGTGNSGTGNRSGGTAATTGTDGGVGAMGGTTGAGGAIATTGAGGRTATTGAGGFRLPVGGMAGHSPGVGGNGGDGDGGSPAVDASTTTPPVDGGDCQCVLGADEVLRMSWACFNTYFGGGSPMSGWCAGGVAGGWVSSCGLDIYKLNRDDSAIPDDEWVYDAGGNLVGQQIAETSPVFVCPTAPTLWPAATVVAAGQFPASGCAVADCTCGDAGAVNCPMPDAGTRTINPF
jgi:hypothetical protein